MDGNGALFGTLSGNTREVLHKFTVDLPKKHGKMALSFELHCDKPAPIAQLVECPLRGTGGHRLDPGSRHTKVVKNGTSCSLLGTQTYGVELGLVDPVSG